MRILSIAVFIRILKVLPYLYEIGKFRLILDTVKNMMLPFWSLIILQYSILYVFSLIGIYAFGGEVTNASFSIIKDQSIPDVYLLINFNDFSSANITMFILMIVNNWQVIVQEYQVITGSNMCILFFVAFYYFGVLIGLNILLAFFIDMYQSIQQIDKAKKEQEKNFKVISKIREKMRMQEFFISGAELHFDNNNRTRNQ